jgi:hypothetical protein
MAQNPYKSNVVSVEPGNYTGARLAGGAVADPIRVAGRLADYHLGQLNKSNPSLYEDFWKAVEGGKTSTPAQQWFREVANGVHKESNALGTPTRYKQNWELRAASLKDTTPEQIATGQLGSIAKHTIQRKYATHAEFELAAQKAGLAVEKDPRAALRKYVAATSSSLERRAIAKSLAEADAANPVKPHTLDLGWGTTVPLSDKGLMQAKGVKLVDPSGKVLSLYDAINSMAKGSLLSISQFHPFNISVLRAGTSLVMPKLGDVLHGDVTAGVHPVRAARGVYGTFRPLAPGGEKYVMKNLAESYGRGDIAFASRHGLPFGQTAYGELGGKFNVGHKMVFEKQLPMMHKEIVGAMRSAMKTYGLEEGSPKALELGKVMNATMGFMNRQAMNVSPGVRKGIQRIFLAGQFTPSKLVNVKQALTKGSAAGAYARADVASNAIAAAALIGGLGYVLHQKSDDIRDIALRALINPAAPTSLKDKKGNTQEVRIPLTYTSELAHILGIKLVRQKDGHLGIDFHAQNIPGTAGEWAKARLSPVASAVVKLKTNTNFADKPLYDPNAPTGTQAEQAATTLLQGVLPIGVQGLPYSNAVKKHLPGNVQDVLEAGSPGTNPLIKSAASSIGFTPRTDQTVGRAADTANYFATKEQFYNSLNKNEKALFDKINPEKKGPFGTQIFNKVPLTSPSAYADLLANQSFRNKYQAYEKAQKSHDPLWDLSPNNLRDYMNAQVISKYNPGGDTTTTNKLYDRLPKDFFSNREQYFAGLQKQGVQLSGTKSTKPSMSQDLVDFSNNYHKLPYGTGARSSALRSSEGQKYIAWLNQNRVYNNQERADLGLPPLEPPNNTFSSSGSSGKTTARSSRSGSTRSARRSSSSAPKAFNPYKYAIKGRRSSIPSPKVSIKKGNPKAKSTAIAKPKVSLTKSKV